MAMRVRSCFMFFPRASELAPKQEGMDEAEDTQARGQLIRGVVQTYASGILIILRRSLLQNPLPANK